MLVRQEFTTLHHERKRNKVHKFRELSDIPKLLGEVTGITKCGHKIYTSLRVPRPTDTKCKLCFR